MFGVARVADLNARGGRRTDPAWIFTSKREAAQVCCATRATRYTFGQTDSELVFSKNTATVWEWACGIGVRIGSITKPVTLWSLTAERGTIKAVIERAFGITRLILLSADIGIEVLTDTLGIAVRPIGTAVWTAFVAPFIDSTVTVVILLAAAIFWGSGVDCRIVVIAILRTIALSNSEAVTIAVYTLADGNAAPGHARVTALVYKDWPVGRIHANLENLGVEASRLSNHAGWHIGRHIRAIIRWIVLIIIVVVVVLIIAGNVVSWRFPRDS